MFGSMGSSSEWKGPAVWRRRVERTRELADRPVTTTEPLRFYERVLRFQAGVAERFDRAARSTVRLRDQIDRRIALSNVPRVLALACEHGPRELANRAHRLKQRGESDWEIVLASVIGGKRVTDPLEDFFTRACIQPIAERLQVQIPADGHYLKSTCPACGGLPQVAILRAEGEGASRSLLCSFCLREWAFRRIICPSCGEEDKEKLPRYSAPECGHISVEACDSCSSYLKCVDMSVDGHAEPLVDEAAAASLDLWAVHRGYTKIVRNLVGF
jgi:FdhE protein